MPYKYTKTIEGVVDGSIDNRITTYKNPYPFNIGFPFYCEQETDSTGFYDIIYDLVPEETLTNYCESIREICVLTQVVDKTNIAIPTFLPTDSALWLDADDSSTITLVSGAVSEWRDKSGNLRHATQATAENRPLLVADGLNGTDVIRFDGTNDILQSTTTIDLTSGFTFFYIGKNRIAKNYQGIFRIHNTITTSTDNCVIYYQTGGNSGNLVSSANNFARYLQTNSIMPPVNNYGIININHNTTSTGNHYVNGIIQTTSNVGSGSLFPSVANTYYIGVGYGDTSRFDGDISQIIIFPRVLTQAEREEMEGYLAWSTGLQGNLPVGHPYKDSYTGVTVTEQIVCTDFYDFAQAP